MRKTSVHDMRLIVCHDGAANVTNSEFNLNHVTAGRPTIATYKQKPKTLSLLWSDSQK